MKQNSAKQNRSKLNCRNNYSWNRIVLFFGWKTCFVLLFHFCFSFCFCCACNCLNNCIEYRYLAESHELSNNNIFSSIQTTYRVVVLAAICPWCNYYYYSFICFSGSSSGWFLCFFNFIDLRFGFCFEFGAIADLHEILPP